MLLLDSEYPHTLLACATLKAIACKDESATRQLLRTIAGMSDKTSTKLVQRLYTCLNQSNQIWLRQTISPGLKNETWVEGSRRVSKNTAEI